METPKGNWNYLIQSNKLIPIIGNSVCNRHVLGQETDKLLLSWGEKVGYPWPEVQTVTSVAQYGLMSYGVGQTKRDYLDCLKNVMMDKAKNDPTISKKQIDKIEEKSIDQFTVTDLAYDLGLLDFEKTDGRPLGKLARLPFKVYITTSYHRFLEVALIRAGKKPVSEIYPWDPALVTLPSTFSDLQFVRSSNTPKEPDRDNPLVYHIFGRDDVPESLVLSENDYLEILIRLTLDTSGGITGANENAEGKLVTQGLPRIVRDQLVFYNSPLLLGYELNDWDFRVLFRGLIKTNKVERMEQGFFIQLLPTNLKNENDVKEHLGSYMKSASNVKILWCDVDQCVQEIHNTWKNQ